MLMADLRKALRKSHHYTRKSNHVLSHAGTAPGTCKTSTSQRRQFSHGLRCKNPLTVFYFTNQKLSAFYLLLFFKFSASKKLVQSTDMRG
jgi:phosphoribosyl-dephospho-CoA transferase